MKLIAPRALLATACFQSVAGRLFGRDNAIFNPSGPGLNGFVTSGDHAFPSTFNLEDASPFYWTNLTGYMYLIQAMSTTQTMDIYAAHCVDSDSDGSCISYENINSGGGFFGGPHFNGLAGNALTAGGPWQINLYWVLTSMTATPLTLLTARSPIFTVVQNAPTEATTTSTVAGTTQAANSVGLPTASPTSISEPSSSSADLSPGAIAGIAIGTALAGAIIAVTAFGVWWRRRAMASRSEYQQPIAELYHGSDARSQAGINDTNQLSREGGMPKSALFELGDSTQYHSQLE